MKHLLSLLLTTILCATASAQTIKSLGFNITNGQVVANTGTNTLRFTNNVSFQGGPLISGNGVFYGTNEDSGLHLADRELYAQGQSIFAYTTNSIEFYVELGFSTTNVAATTRTNLGLGATWLTNTNVTNFRTAVGLGAGNDVAFNETTVFSLTVQDVTPIYIAGDGLSFNDTNSTNVASAKAGWRDSLGLPLSTLTNTSNVTMMRALSGSTNTNHPYSGSISVTGTNNTNTLVFSNGILQSVQ